MCCQVCCQVVLSSVLSSVLSIVLSSGTVKWCCQVVLSSGDAKCAVKCAVKLAGKFALQCAVMGTVSTLFSKGCLLLLTHRQDETSHPMVRKIQVCIRIREPTTK